MNKQKPRNRWTAQEWFEFAATGIAPTEPGGGLIPCPGDGQVACPDRALVSPGRRCRACQQARREGRRSRTTTNSKGLPGAGPGKAAPPSGSSLLSSPGGVRQSQSKPTQDKEGTREDQHR